jgi:hypothetical protein
MACFAEDEACKPFKAHWLPDVKTGSILQNAHSAHTVFMCFCIYLRKKQHILPCVT